MHQRGIFVPLDSPDVVPVERPAVVDADAVALEGGVSAANCLVQVANKGPQVANKSRKLTLVSRWHASAPPPGGQLMRFCGFVGSVWRCSTVAAAARPAMKTGRMAAEKRMTIEVGW